MDNIKLINNHLDKEFIHLRVDYKIKKDTIHKKKEYLTVGYILGMKGNQISNLFTIIKE